MPYIYITQLKKIIWGDPKLIFTKFQRAGNATGLVTQQDLSEGRGGIEG